MYLDPGSWSMAFQILVGAVLSIPLLVGVYWGKVKEYFPRRRVRIAMLFSLLISPILAGATILVILFRRIRKAKKDLVT